MTPLSLRCCDDSSRYGLPESVTPKTVGNFREVSRYRITLDSADFQSLLHSIHERTKVERDLERQLRSELKAVPIPTNNPDPTPAPEAAAYPGTTLSTVVECEQIARSTVVGCAAEELPAELPLPLKAMAWAKRKPCVESTSTWKTPHFTIVGREEA